MTVTKPDATVFDNADDSIATSRAELYTLATSFNTIADEYNAGTLGGVTEIVAGNNITVTQPDSAGAFTISASNFQIPDSQETVVTRTGATVTSDCVAGVTNVFRLSGASTYTHVVNIDNLGYNGTFLVYWDPSAVVGGAAYQFRLSGANLLTGSATTTPLVYRVSVINTLKQDSAGGTELAIFGQSVSAVQTYTV